MIQVKTVPQESVSRGKSFIKCKKCHKEEWFYSFLHERCMDCGTEWGSIVELVDLQGCRIGYHFKPDSIYKTWSHP